MINKKLFVLSFLLLFVFLVAYNYADGKNFVTILNGSSFGSDTSVRKNTYSFVGQPVVFTTKEDTNLTSQSAFASVFRITQSSNIAFENTTSSDPFEDITVPLTVTIRPTNGKKITKIRYRIWQGENADWNNYTISPEYDYENFTINSDGSVDFEQEVTLSDGNPINYFMVYAQLEDESKRWSDAYTVKLSPGLSSGVKIVSPDKLSGVATTDPQVETTSYSIDFTTATVTLYEGEQTEGNNYVYKVVLSTTTNELVKMYNDGKISYTHSTFAPKYNENKGAVNPDQNPPDAPLSLKNNQVYTLVVISQNNKSETPQTDSVKFKTLSGGVADILTYPSPFNPNKEKIKIRYLLSKGGYVTIRLYDKAGKVVCKLIDSEYRAPGTNEEEWDGRNYAGEKLATGAYIVEIIAGSDRRYTALAIVGK